MYSFTRNSILCLGLTWALCHPVFAERPKLRLSGTAIVSQEKSYAVLEYADGRSRRVTQGETVEGWGRITAIGPGEIVVETAEGDQAMVISGGNRPVPIASDPRESKDEEASPIRISGEITPDIIKEVERLAGLPGASGESLNDRVPVMLGLSPSARIVAINHEPLSDDSASLISLQTSLKEGGARLSIEGDENTEAVYLLQPSADSPQ
ncbi:MAG: hypothetical protein KDI63_05325 [Gammaproteobacteria bacterium]|nr:hypothetical protein [Gammaproteobacteria bacterium]